MVSLATEFLQFLTVNDPLPKERIMEIEKYITESSELSCRTWWQNVVGHKSIKSKVRLKELGDILSVVDGLTQKINKETGRLSIKNPNKKIQPTSFVGG